MNLLIFVLNILFEFLQLRAVIYIFRHWIHKYLCIHRYMTKIYTEMKSAIIEKIFKYVYANVRVKKMLNSWQNMQHFLENILDIAFPMRFNLILRTGHWVSDQNKWLFWTINFKVFYIVSSKTLLVSISLIINNIPPAIQLWIYSITI